LADNTIQILILAQNMASDVLQAAGGDADGLGEKLANAGTRITLATAGIAAGLASAAAAAISYDASMTNTAAVLGLTRDEQAALSSEILAFSRNTVAGPQAVSEAFYDIAGGVADASTHMAILEAATRTAEAGSADLGGTTAGLISIMNSYKFSAEQAGFASDVMTKIVGAGVGTMDEFAAALPQVTGLAASLGVGFDEVGAATAYLTTQGYSAGVATTQLRASMLAMLNPNEKMKAALEEMGYATGQAAIEELGLHGALMAVSEAAGDDVTAALGSAEALMAVVALQGDGAAEAMENFQDSIDGATDAARAVQLQSAANQMALFNSSVSAISIEVGSALIPALNEIIAQVRPVLDSVFEWMQANPELTGTIVALAGGLVVLGPLLMALGSGIAVLTSPITLVVGAFVALGAAISTNFLGIADLLQPVFDFISGAVEMVTVTFGNFTDTVEQGGSIIDGIISVITGAFSNLMVYFGFIDGANFVEFQNTVEGALQGVVSIVTDTVLPTLQALANWFLTEALPAVIGFVRDTVMPIFESVFGFLANVWAMVGPALESVKNWFVNDALPAITSLLNDTVIPALEAFFGTISDLWEVARPHLENLANWFLTEALPSILSFISDTVVPAVQGFIDILVRIWNDVSPFLVNIFDWFMTSGLPLIRDFIEGVVVPVVQSFIDILVGIWNLISPVLGEMYNWFITNGLPWIQQAIETVTGVVQGFIDILTGLWALVSPILSELFNWFNTNGLPWIQQAIETVTGVVQGFVDILTGLWTSVQPFLEGLKNGIEGVFNWIKNNVINPAVSAVQSIIDAWNRAMEALGLYRDEAAALSSATLNNGGNGIPIDPGEWRDNGGPGIAGRPYMIGAGAQPEVFIPQTNGNFIPNFDELFGTSGGGAGSGGGGGTTYQVSVTVTERDVLTESVARTNGDIFGMRILEELNHRG
jgi:TP901 family phage tail tape measure protein